MNRVARLKSFLVALLFRRRMERDMAREWQFHLDARVAHLRAGGLSQVDATTRARGEFGDPLRWKEGSREARGVQVVDQLRQDIASGVRQLSRAPMFTVVAIVTLALGIGANTAIFSVVHAVLLRPLPFEGSDRLVRFLENFPAPPGSVGAAFRVPGMDLVEVETLRARAGTLSHVAVAVGTTMILTGRDDAIRLVFTLAVAVLTGVVFGLTPAIRHSAQRTMLALRDGSGSSSISGFDVFRRLRIQGLLVIAEIAMATMLFVGGGLLIYAVLLGIFAAVAVTLAAVGIYGVMAYAVTRRTREIGIRMALGAARFDVLRLVLGQSLVLTAVGIAFGLAGAVAVTHYLRGLLFGLTPLDPMTFVVVAVVFGSIATLAASVPARRATNVDPLIALRYE